jgi:hypothetical protein
MRQIKKNQAKLKAVGNKIRMKHFAVLLICGRLRRVPLPTSPSSTGWKIFATTGSPTNARTDTYESNRAMNFVTQINYLKCFWSCILNKQIKIKVCFYFFDWIGVVWWILGQKTPLPLNEPMQFKKNTWHLFYISFLLLNLFRCFFVGWASRLILKEFHINLIFFNWEK